MQFGFFWLVFAGILIYTGAVQDWPQGLLTTLQWTILGITGGIAVLDYLRSCKQFNTEL